MHYWRRLGLIVVLLCGLFGLGVYADVTGEARWPYPSTDDVAGDYERYVGEETLLFGTVESVDDSEARIRVDHDTDSFRMTVRNFDVPVESGGIVQVYGTLEDDFTVDARRVTVVNPAAGSNLYKYAVSALAVVLFLGLFFRYWRVNVDSLRLEPRDGGG